MLMNDLRGYIVGFICVFNFLVIGEGVGYEGFVES